ncbi:MAG: hypothetical protein FWC17_03350 [Treponema sp.]|nr:hypothetical protein [Treponema sp.]
MKSDNFRRSDDNYYASGAYYQWDIHSTQDEYGIQNGYSMILIPAGLEIKDGNRIFLSDTSKTRLLIMQNEFNPSSQIYYWEDVMPEQFNAQELRISNFITSDNYYDLSLPGSLSPGQGIWYSVRTAEAGFLNVSASSDIDTYLEAYDQDMKLIAQNDDWESWNPVIEFLAKANTLYYFRINSYSGNDSGPFRITALHKPLPLITEMTNGSFIRAYIEAGEEHWYSVTVTEGDFLSIWTEGNTDTVIDAYTENYVHFTRNDDSWYGDYVDRNANLWINIYDVKAGTVYLFRLTSFDSGAYRILVSMDYAQG